MKSNYFKLIIFIILLSSLLSGCTNYEKQFADKAKIICTENKLDCEVEMSLILRDGAHKIYDLIIYSDNFEEKTTGEKIKIIKEFDYIFIPQSKIGVIPVIYSQGNEYKYYKDSGGLHINNESITSNTNSLNTNSSSSSSSSTSWFAGGTLHNSTVSQWREASYANRLATAADFVVATQDVDFGNLDEFKDMVIDLETCITEAVSGGDVDNELVSFISSLCTVML